MVWIDVENVCHANEQLSLFISFQLMFYKHCVVVQPGPKSHTVSKKLEHTEMACLLSWMSGKETLFPQGERLMRNNYY